MMPIRFSLLISGLLLLCGAAGCDRATAPQYDPPAVGTVSIAGLKNRCHSASVLITEAIAVEGIVTANDEQGERVKSLVIEDESGGIEIAVDCTQLYARYPIGTVLTVLCQGLALGDYGGKIQLGAPPAGEYTVDRIPEATLLQYLRPTGSQWRVPARRTFRELAPQHIDTYVRFDGVAFARTEQGEPFSAADSIITERHLIDNAGDTLTVRLRPTCIYAAEPIPAGTGSVMGIVDYFNGRYSLCIANYGVEGFTRAAPPTAYLSAVRSENPSPTR